MKEIFDKAYEEYGMRVILGHYAGLWDIDPTDKEGIKADVKRMTEAYGEEEWLLAHQIGNENNYHLPGGRLALQGPVINMTDNEYYQFVDELGGVVKEVDENHPVLLGNGELTRDDALLIKDMKNIDALSINSYRDPADIDSLFEWVKLTEKPAGLGEYGQPSDALGGRKAQDHYINSVDREVISNMATQDGADNAIFAFTFEATDERWRLGRSLRGGSKNRFGIMTYKESGLYDPCVIVHDERTEPKLIFVERSDDWKDTVYYDIEGREVKFGLEDLKEYKRVSPYYGILTYEYMDNKGRRVIITDKKGKYKKMENVYFVKEFRSATSFIPEEMYHLYTDSERNLRAAEVHRTGEVLNLDEIEANGKTIAELDAEDEDLDNPNMILADVEKIITRINREMRRDPSDYSLIQVEVETKTGEKYYKYLVPGDKYGGRAVLTVRGNYLTVVTEWSKENPRVPMLTSYFILTSYPAWGKINTRIPMKSYLVDTDNGATSLYVDNVDTKHIFYLDAEGRIVSKEELKEGKDYERRYKIATDESDYVRVRMYNPNTGEIWYRWYREYDLLKRWEYEEKGLGDVEKDFVADPEREGYSKWNPKFKTYIGKRNEESKSFEDKFEDKYVEGTDIAKNSELYYISENLKSHKDWDAEVKGIRAWHALVRDKAVVYSPFIMDIPKEVKE
ncbi:MAG: hypothetical protein WBC40_11255 [Halobacteriota archaeon]